MATTARIPIQEEVTQLERELSTLKSRLAGEERALQSLNAEAEAIAAGTKRADGALAGRIGETETRILGLRAAIGTAQGRYDGLHASLRQQQADAAEATWQAQLDDLVRKGAESAGELTAAITACIARLNSYCAVRRQLGSFVDAGTLPNLQPAPGGAAQRVAQARAALAAMHSEIFDGARLRAIRGMLKDGWVLTDDPTIEIHEMRPPRK